MKKFILTDETIEIFGVTLHRIKAVRSFGNVKEGEFGRSYRHFRYDGKVYKSKKKLLEAIKEL